MNSWPHAPSHLYKGAGAYMVTSGTYLKVPLFDTAQKLDLLTDRLFTLADEYGWQLQAWAVFANHYHFVGFSPETGSNLQELTRKLHGTTSRELNLKDGKSGRKVWFDYWDTPLSYEKSYYARLNYVHQNAVKHGLVGCAADYRWCSAAWFEQKADNALIETVKNFPCDRFNVKDDY